MEQQNFTQLAFNLLPKDLLDMILLKMDMESVITLCREYYPEVCENRNILGRILTRDFFIPPELYEDDIYAQYKTMEKLTTVYLKLRKFPGYYPNLDLDIFRRNKESNIADGGKPPSLSEIYYIIKYKIRREKDHNYSYEDSEGDFFTVVESYYHPIILQMLIDEKGVDLSSGLYPAVASRHIDRVKFLLDRGADPNYNDGYIIRLAHGFTLYHDSGIKIDEQTGEYIYTDDEGYIEDKEDEILKLLIERGGNPEAIQDNEADAELVDQYWANLEDRMRY